MRMRPLSSADGSLRKLPVPHTPAGGGCERRTPRPGGAGCRQDAEGRQVRISGCVRLPCGRVQARADARNRGLRTRRERAGRLPRRGAAPQPDPPAAEGPGRLRRAGRASVSAGPRGRIAGRGFAARSPPRTGTLPVAERMMLRFVTSNCNFQTKHRIFIKFFIPLLTNRHEFAPISIKTLRYYVR